MAAVQDVEEFDDSSKLWFGKHTGVKLANVPAEYLLWWYGEFGNTGRPIYGVNKALKRYIEQNMDSLLRESGND